MLRDDVIYCCWKIWVWNYVYFTQFNIFFHLGRWLCLLGQSLDSRCHCECHSRSQGTYFRTFRQQRQDKSLRLGLSIVSCGRLEAVNDTFVLSLFSFQKHSQTVWLFPHAWSMGEAEHEAALSPLGQGSRRVNHRKISYRRGDYMDETSKQGLRLSYAETRHGRSWIFPPLLQTMYSNDLLLSQWSNFSYIQTKFPLK